jgi:hypothetical protein
MQLGYFQRQCWLSRLLCPVCMWDGSVFYFDKSTNFLNVIISDAAWLLSEAVDILFIISLAAILTNENLDWFHIYTRILPYYWWLSFTFAVFTWEQIDLLHSKHTTHWKGGVFGVLGTFLYLKSMGSMMHKRKISIYLNKISQNSAVVAI